MLAFVCGAVIVWGPPHTNAQVCGFLVWNLDLHRITEPLGVCVWGRNCVGSESELFMKCRRGRWRRIPSNSPIEITFLVNNTPVFNIPYQYHSTKMQLYFLWDIPVYISGITNTRFGKRCLFLCFFMREICIMTLPLFFHKHHLSKKIVKSLLGDSFSSRKKCDKKKE